MTTHCLLIPHQDEPAESIVARFKKKLMPLGLFKEQRKRAYYEKPSVKKRRKQTEARKKKRKSEAKAAHIDALYGERMAARKVNPEYR